MNTADVDLLSSPSPIGSLPLIYRGKVRDIHEIDSEHWLLVATDRASAFDVVLPTPIPGKGQLLTELALFWFERFRAMIPNHLAPISLEEVLQDPAELEYARNRSMIVKRLKALPVEAVVRGYLAGSGWRDYTRTGAMCGHELEPDLREAERLLVPLFTPATKAALGEHDENIDGERLRELVGRELADDIERISLAIYRDAARYAQSRGILIADTKFEFGLNTAGNIVLMDEILTPDSSRFWDAATWQAGTTPASYDKQFLRDWLETQDWNKTAPGPTLPPDIVAGTIAGYREAVRRLTAG